MYLDNDLDEGKSMIEFIRNSTTIRLVKGALDAQSAAAVVSVTNELPLAEAPAGATLLTTEAPQWVDGQHGENVLVERCHSVPMVTAAKAGLRSIAFPAIASRTCGYPLDRVGHIVFNTIVRTVDENDGAFDTVTVVVESDEELAAYASSFDVVTRTMAGV